MKKLLTFVVVTITLLGLQVSKSFSKDFTYNPHLKLEGTVIFSNNIKIPYYSIRDLGSPFPNESPYPKIVHMNFPFYYNQNVANGLMVVVHEYFPKPNIFGMLFIIPNGSKMDFASEGMNVATFKFGFYHQGYSIVYEYEAENWKPQVESTYNKYFVQKENIVEMHKLFTFTKNGYSYDYYLFLERGNYGSYTYGVITYSSDPSMIQITKVVTNSPKFRNFALTLFKLSIEYRLGAQYANTLNQYYK
jgi:hypothetical protein